MYNVKIIADSIYNGSRLTTFQLMYPRFIHSEFMTHRVFSRNASSSRAIPVSKMIEQVRTNPAMPIHWGKNQSGMQATEELDADMKQKVQTSWEVAANNAALLAETMMECGAHKQVVNRILEPYQWISVVCTATTYDNFFALRSHADAQPEIKLLSDMMMAEYNSSVPKVLERGWYHLPYVSDEELKTLDIETLCKCSAARCARVSYLTHDNKTPSIEKDLQLFDRLVGSEPIHASPTEHQSRAGWAFVGSPGKNGNLDISWGQLRCFIDKKEEDLFFVE